MTKTDTKHHRKGYSTGELEVFIISAHRSTNTPEQNARLHAEMKGLLAKRYGHTFIKQVRGSWQGVEEDSFVVNGDAEHLTKLATSFGQDSILWLDTNRRAYLLHKDKPEHLDYLGRLVAVTEAVAKEQEGWTYDKKSGQYYTIK